MQLRELLLERRKQIRVIAEGQLSVQTAHNVQFRSALAHGFTGNPERLVDIMRVGVSLAGSAIEAAELTISVANVGRIEMAIDVEIGTSAVLSPAHSVGEFTQSR